MDIAINDLPMISGKGAVAERVHRKVECPRGVWLISVSDDNSADHLHFHDPKDRHSEGYGGSTLKFKLEDGTYYEAKGPWKSNPGNLFLDTGVDLRDKHHTRVVIAKGIRFDKNPRSYMGSTAVLTDVVYHETEFQVSHWDRWRDVLNSLPAGEYHAYREGYGGSTRGMEKSDGSRFAPNCSGESGEKK